MPRRTPPPTCPGCGRAAHGALVDACAFARLEARVLALEIDAENREATVGNLLHAMVRHGLRIRGLVEAGPEAAGRALDIETVSTIPAPYESGGELDEGAEKEPGTD